MSQADVKPIQNWQEIAARVAAETDPNKVADLAKELITALDKRSNRRFEEVTPESKTLEKGAA
jgi:phage terminase Nu1 subunit (DNA packaging protein)